MKTRFDDMRDFVGNCHDRFTVKDGNLHMLGWKKTVDGAVNLTGYEYIVKPGDEVTYDSYPAGRGVAIAVEFKVEDGDVIVKARGSEDGRTWCIPISECRIVKVVTTVDTTIVETEVTI